MKKAVALVAICVLLVGLIAPTTASARGWRGGWHGGHGWHGWWWPGAVIGGLLFGAAIAASYPPYGYAEPTVIYAPPEMVSPPAPVYAAPAVSPPVQREVVYPHGRYVLLGDGVTRPWEWIWVPAPPPGPPPATVPR